MKKIDYHTGYIPDELNKKKHKTSLFDWFYFKGEVDYHTGYLPVVYSENKKNKPMIRKLYVTVIIFSIFIFAIAILSSDKDKNKANLTDTKNPAYLFNLSAKDSSNSVELSFLNPERMDKSINFRN